MAFTRQYVKLLRPEKRISQSQIRPRNIYRITTYKGGNPPTKTAEEARYVFVIGIIDKKIHCIKINPINPLHFTQLIGKLRDKRLPLSSDLRLDPVNPKPPRSLASFSPFPEEDIIATSYPLECKCLAASAPIPEPEAINAAIFFI